MIPNYMDIMNMYADEGEEGYDGIDWTAPRPLKGDSILAIIDDYVCVDLETTGFSPNRDKIIEIGALRVVGGKPAGTYNALVNIGEPLSDTIKNLTGISDAEICNGECLDAALAGFADFIKHYDVLLGHNVNFDINFLYDNLTQQLGYPLSNDFVDTMNLAKRLYNLGSYKLSKLVKMFGFADDVEHRALSDCIDTYRCYEHMKQYINDNEIDIENYNVARNARKRHLGLVFRVDIVGKKICLTGEFECASRKRLEQELSSNGAIVKKSVSKGLDFLVVGKYCNEQWKDGKGSKTIAAEKYNLNGSNITIINENDFVEE